MSHSFKHVSVSGDVFLSDLRQAFSEVWVRKFIHYGKTLLPPPHPAPSTVGIDYFKTSEAETAALDQYIQQQQDASDVGKAPTYCVVWSSCRDYALGGLVAGGAVDKWRTGFLSIVPKVATICWKLFRQRGRQRVLAILCCYNMLLMVLFIVGLLADDGYGWAFVPLMIRTAPWSFLAPAVVHGTVGNWFASGLIGNFVLFVILCGAINSFLLYMVIRRTVYADERPARQTLL